MSFRSSLRTAVATALEGSWRLAFGTWKSAEPGCLSPTGGKRVLVVAPHPDDEAIGCVGTVLLHVASGDKVCIAIATDGRRSRSVTDDPDRMATLRRSEAARAAQLMRVDRLEWMGLPEGEWTAQQLLVALTQLMEELRPDIIYAPSRIDFHPEHLKVAHTLALALGPIARNVRVRVYQVQVPLSPAVVNLVADVSAVQVDCAAVFAAYSSQAGSLECGYRQRRYGASRYGRRGYVEEFWELSAQQYVAVHSEPLSQWRPAFRGLRRFPLTDPLAYLVGNTERRRIRASSLR